MFQGRFHKNYAAIQSAVLQAEASSGQASGLGVPNFWYDGSLAQYVIPVSAASTSASYTSVNMLSKFVGGPGFAIKAFGIGSSTSMANPDYYINYTAAINPKIVNTFTAYIATGTAVQVQGTLSTATSVGGQSQAVLTLTSAPGTGITIGAAITGGNLPANTWVFSTVTNTSTYYLISSNGTTFATSASTVTYTVTPVVMTVTTTSGILSPGHIIKHATAANISGISQITARVSATTGGTGTYYISQPQTQGSAGSPIAGYYTYMPNFNFSNGDGFRVAMTGSNVLTGYTWFMAARIGSTSSAATTVGLLGTDHNFNNTTASGYTIIGEGMDRIGSNLRFRVAGTTATTTAVINTTSWHIYAGVFTGGIGGSTSTFDARVDGVSLPLTRIGTMSTATLNPGLLTFTGTNVTALTATGAIATATVVTPNSQFFNVGQTITLGGWTISGTQGTINGTQIVTACTTNTVSFAITGTITTTTTKGYISGTPIVNLYVPGNAPAAYGAVASNNATAGSSSNGLGLELGELVWFNSALGTTAVQAFETYLKNKWLGTN